MYLEKVGLDKRDTMRAFFAFLKSLFTAKPTPEVKPPVKPIEKPVQDDSMPWYKIALKEVGTKELDGSANNPRVIKYHKSTSLKAEQDSVPWCSSFVTWCLEEAGYKSTDSAWARSYLKYGTKLEHGKKGCIVVFTRGTDSGHVAFYERETAHHIYCLGGNQSNEVNVKPYAKANLLGYRWPVK